MDKTLQDKANLIEMLRDLARSMGTLAVFMNEIADERIKQKAIELTGAAHLTLDWADGIEREVSMAMVEA